MADSVTDELTGVLRTVFKFSRANALELGSITNAATKVTTYSWADGSGPGEADMVFADTRTIPANTMETFDLLDLDQQTLGVGVNFEFKQLRCIRVVNESTTAGRRLLIGASVGSPTSVYAAEVGPGGEWHAVNNIDSWEVTSANSTVTISNPNAAAVTYSLYLVGTSVEP